MIKLKVLIVDDHSTVRQGLKTFLELDPQIQVIGTAVNGVEAIQKTRELKPDVVLMDLLMPQMDGIEAMKRIKVDDPSAKIIIVTGYDDEALRQTAMQAGAFAYVLKDNLLDLTQLLAEIGQARNPGE